MPSRLIMTLAVGFLISVALDSSYGASVVFRDSSDSYLNFVAGWDHVGFEIDGYVWESHPGYDYPGFFGFAYDPEEFRYVVMPTESGVQRWHTNGSFRWNSSDPDESKTLSVVPLPIDYSLASAMEAEALAVQSYGYPSIPSLVTPWGLDASNQKGALGTFTCVGFVEYLAEAAGYHGGQGFIPDNMETLPAGGSLIPALTPGLLAAAILGNWTPSMTHLHGIIDPVDFILTDPLGRRVGYTNQLGLLNEIPGMVYTGNGDFEELILDNPSPGLYQVELFGLGTNALFAIGDGTGEGLFYNGFLGSDQMLIGTFLVQGDVVASGDFNNDGVVDAADYVVWRKNNGSQTDYNTWRSKYGGPAGNGSGSAAGIQAAVPEPASAWLLIVGTVVATWRGRRIASHVPSSR